MASAVARAAVETETSMAVPRFQVRRVAGKVVVACSPELAAFAEELGRKADRLAESDPLPPPLRVFQELYEVGQPQQPLGCQPFGNERLLKLAAAMSRTAAVSPRQELYPRGMAAERALRLGLGALSGLGLGDGEEGFTIDQIRDRLRSRYPEAEPLPGRPDLDALLHRVGLEVRWDDEKKVYRRREGRIVATSGSSIPSRRTTATSTRKVEVTPDLAEARQFEERLRHAHGDGGFLVLTVRPSRMRRCEDELLRRFPIERVSFDDLLFEALRREAEELEIDWAIIEQADGADRSGQDWNNLLHLVARAAPKVVAELCNRRDHLLLVNPGLIARYDQMAVLETLRDKVGHDVPCPGLWVLVATDGQHDLPMLDNAEIPLITPGQRARVSEAWVDNVHRGQPKQGRRLPWSAGREAAEHGRHQDAAARTAEAGRDAGRRLARPVDERRRDRRRAAGELHSRSRREAGPPRATRSGGRTTSNRSPWRGCSPASSSGSWKTTTSSTSAGLPARATAASWPRARTNLLPQASPRDGPGVPQARLP